MLAMFSLSLSLYLFASLSFSLSLSLPLPPGVPSQIPASITLTPSWSSLPFAPPFSRFVPLCRGHSLFLPGRKEANEREEKSEAQSPYREGEASGVESSRVSKRTLDAILENGVDVCARRVREKRERE